MCEQWKGNQLDLTEWGWLMQGQMIVPVESDQQLAPTSLLNLVSCGCKGGCTRACECRKLVLHCTPMCSQCGGQTYTNIDDIEDDN